jgi:hypothetical protein
VHEVGRNADIFDDNAGRLLKVGSSIVYQSAHLHSGGSDVKSKLLFGFRFIPVGYKPAQQTTLHSLANALDIDIKPTRPTSNCMRMKCCRSPRRSSRSSRTCTRRVSACASKRSGASTSRR